MQMTAARRWKARKVVGFRGPVRTIVRRLAWMALDCDRSISGRLGYTRAESSFEQQTCNCFSIVMGCMPNAIAYKCRLPSYSTNTIREAARRFYTPKSSCISQNAAHAFQYISPIFKPITQGIRPSYLPPVLLSSIPISSCPSLPINPHSFSLYHRRPCPSSCLFPLSLPSSSNPHHS